MSKNFPPRIPRWTGKISVRILGGNFPSEDSSVDEKKTTEEVVLVKFFVVHGLKVICCLESTEDWQFPSEDAVLSSCGQEFRRKCYRGNTEELMWTGISEKMLPRKYLLSHRGAHADRNFRENITEEYLLKWGTPYYKRGITVGRRGQILNPPRSSVAYFPPRHYFFSTEAWLSDCVGQGVLYDIVHCYVFQRLHLI